MDKDLRIQTEKLNTKHRRKRIWYRILSIPVCIVVFVTTYAMILPAITLESTPDTYCGQEEHIHSDDCYETPGVPEHKEITCTVAGELGEGEYIVHTHDTFCFNDSGELMCSLPEQTEHTHSDECYENGRLVCTMLTPVMHQHTDECISVIPAVEPQGLTCTLTAHKHTEECFIAPDSETTSGTQSTETETSADEISSADTTASETAANVTAAETTDKETSASETASTVETASVSETTEKENSSNTTTATTASETTAGETSADETTAGKDAVINAAVVDANAVDAAAVDANAVDAAANINAASVGNTDVAITLTDDVANSGNYVVSITSGSEALADKDVQFLWYKSTDGGSTYTAVAQKVYSVGGSSVPNISDDTTSLFLALEGGTITDTQKSVKYKATLMVDGVEYDEISAEIENTTHQASVLNGSFETPDLASYGFQEFVPEGTEGLYWKTTAANEEGGQGTYPSGSTSTNDGVHYVEMVDTTTGTNKTNATKYHNQGTASDGKQYAEINAGAWGALYQTVATIPGVTMNWSVDHNGRAGTDTMAVVMMPEDTANNITDYSGIMSVVNNPDTYGATVITNLTAGTGSWTTHSGTYTVPEGQYQTRFFFVAVANSGSSATIGNHIDNVWFSQKIAPATSTKPYFELKKTVTGDLSEAELQTLADKLTFELQRSSSRYSSTGMTTQATYKASDIGNWVKNDDGSWTISIRISMKNYTTNFYYQIVESNAEMNGYTLTQTVTPTSAVQLTSSTDTSWEFTNNYADLGRTLKLKKVVNSSDTDGDFGFRVTYTDASGTEQTKNFTLQHNGEYEITGIKKGTSVTIFEKSTDGYAVSMKDTSTGKILSGSSRYTFTLYDDADITVYNTSSVILPETGGIGTHIFIYGGLGIMLAAVVTGYLLRRKYGKEGE